MSKVLRKTQFGAYRRRGVINRFQFLLIYFVIYLSNEIFLKVGGGAVISRKTTETNTQT